MNTKLTTDVRRTECHGKLYSSKLIKIYFLPVLSKDVIYESDFFPNKRL